MPHFFNTPHAFKKIGEMQFGEMSHTPIFVITIFIFFIFFNFIGLGYYKELDFTKWRMS